MPDSRPTLAALLRREDRGTLAAFVADLNAARGATVRREGRVVVADGCRQLIVAPGLGGRLRDRLGSPDATHVDVVVAVDAGRAERLADRYGARARSAADLDRLARYGIERSVADDIFERQLGRAIDAVAPSDPRRRRRAPTETGSPPGRHSTPPTAGSGQRGERSSAWSALALVVGVVLLVSAIGIVPATLDRQASGAVGGSSGPTAPASPGTSTSVGDEQSVGGTGTGDSADRSPAGSARFLAPGLTDAGLTDARALAVAHVAVLGNQSYRWRLRYVETTDGQVSARAAETVRVAETDVYTSNVTRVGTVRGPTFIASGSAYEDVGAHPRFGPESDDETATAGRQSVRATQVLETLLRTRNSTLVQSLLGDHRLYVVDFRGSLSPGIEHYRGTVHVSPSGFVPYLAASYCLHPAAVSALDERAGDADTPSVCARFTMRYTDVGNTSLEESPWYVDTRL